MPNFQQAKHVAVEGHPALQAVYKHDGGRQLASVRLPEFYEHEYSIQAEIIDMARAVVFLLLIVAVASAKFVRPVVQCGENEVYNSCGTACPPSCDNPNPTICTLACVPGCECISGLLRNAADVCVPFHNC
ncbi:hypothetical protein HN011_009231 [Eciton burchellii]|nr:hypothetical protein HN011_009231 [Eciton burchellii]